MIAGLGLLIIGGFVSVPPSTPQMRQDCVLIAFKASDGGKGEIATLQGLLDRELQTLPDNLPHDTQIPRLSPLPDRTIRVRAALPSAKDIEPRGLSWMGSGRSAPPLKRA
jgi:hypothetical protein